MRPQVAFLNGLFMDLHSARVSILDRGFCYGDGLFETMRSYRGRVFRLDAHIGRLFSSLDSIGIHLPATQGEIKRSIQRMMGKNQCPDSMVRLTVSRGEREGGIMVDPDLPPTVVIYQRPFEPLPRKCYEEGIDVSLFPSSASRISGLARQVKSCNFLSYILIREQARKKNSMEGILIDENNRIAEGTTSNIFMVKDGVLKTPEVNEYVLAGITRQAVLEIAASSSIPVSATSLAPGDILAADEVFITNSGIEILPVKRVDGSRIGDGHPGEITRYLHRKFLKSIEREN